MILNIAIQVWGYLSKTFFSMLKFYTTIKYMAFTLGITSLYAFIKLRFEQDHNVSFNVAWPVMLFVGLDLMVQIVGAFFKKFVFRKALEDFFSKIILYWIFIKVVDKICYKEYMGFVGDSLLWGVLVHQALQIKISMTTVFPKLFPEWVNNLDYDTLKSLFKK